MISTITHALPQCDLANLLRQDVETNSLLHESGISKSRS